MISPNGLLVEQTKIVAGFAPATPSTSTPAYISMKGYHKLTVIISVDNANTVTGSAITLKQATAVAGTGEKELSFASVHANIDTATTDALVATAVVANTFTTDTTDTSNLLYVVEVEPTSLDMANGFDCVRVGAGDASGTVVSVVYVLWPARSMKATPISAIVD